MDRRFLEFMGNFMLSVAKGQENLEDMARWMNAGLPGHEEFTALFGRIYGLTESRKDQADHQKALTAAMDLFSASLRECLSLFGAVPRREYLELARKVDELKERVESQEKTIRQLRTLMTEAGREESGDVAGQFQDLVRRQAEQYQKLMESLEQVFRPGDSPPDE